MHADNCKILKADPGVQIEWSEVETGHWRAVCQCGPRMSAPTPPSVVLGATPMTRLPSTTMAGASTVTRAILLSSAPSCGFGRERAEATGTWNVQGATAAGRFRTTPRAAGKERTRTTAGSQCGAGSRFVVPLSRSERMNVNHPIHWDRLRRAVGSPSEARRHG